VQHERRILVARELPLLIERSLYFGDRIRHRNARAGEINAMQEAVGGIGDAAFED
jgi:hypothetical protein